MPALMHRGGLGAQACQILLATLLMAASLVLASSYVGFETHSARRQAGRDPGDSLLAAVRLDSRSLPAECVGASAGEGGASAARPGDPAAASSAPVAASGVVSREWQVALGNDAVDIRAKVVLRRCGDEWRRLEAAMPNALRDWDNAGDDIVSHAMGGVAIDNWPVAFAPPQVLADASAADTVAMAWHGTVPLRDGPFRAKSVGVRLTSAGWPAPTLWRVTSAPATGLWLDWLPEGRSESRPSEGSLQVLLPDDFGAIGVVAARAAPAAASASGAAPSASAASAAADALWQRDTMARLLDTLEQGLGQLLPFAIVALWMRSLRETATTPWLEQVRLNELALALAIAVALGSLMVTTFSLLGSSFAANDRRSAWTGYPAKALLVAFLWPLLACLWRPGRAAAVRPPMAVLLFSATIGLLALAAVPVMSAGVPPAGPGSVLHLVFKDGALSIGPGLAPWPPFAAALAALVLSTAWLGQQCAGWRGLLLAPPVSLLAFFLLELADAPRSWLPPDRVVAALLAIPSGWFLGRASLRWIHALRQSPGTPGLFAAGLAGAGAAAVLVQPAPDFQSPYVIWLATLPADAFVSAWSLLALATIPVWLHRRRAQSERPRPDHPGAAAALLLLVFGARNGGSLLAELAGLLLTWLLASRWLFPRPAIRWPRRRRGSMLDKAIGEMGALNELLRMRRALGKTVGDKVGKMDMTMHDGIARLTNVDRFIGLRAAAGVFARGQAALALNRGSVERPWARGVRAALAASLLSLPWVANYLFSLHRQLADAPFPSTMVTQLDSVLLELLQWPVLGFVLLYFYPHLRGRNGIRKGLALACVLVLPAAVGNLLQAGPLSTQWLGFAYWALQVFICCMTLGVGLGDLVVLRLAGKRWRSIIEIYNAGALAAWSSTLTLAVAGALSAALAGGAGQLVGVVIGQMTSASAPAHSPR